VPTAPDFGFCGPTYQAVSKVLDASRAINLYPEAGFPTSKSKAALIGTPGVLHWATLPFGPVRALWPGVGRLFAVGGTHVYELNSLGAIITDFGAIPGSDGVSPVQIFTGGTNSSNAQSALMDSSVPAIFKVGPGIVSVLSNAWAVEFLDSFYFALGSPGTEQNRIKSSDPLNLSSWPVLNFADRSGNADLALNIAQVNGQLWIFGMKNLEVWANAGLSPFPLERIAGSTINTGVFAQYSIQKVGNIIMWLGASERGFGSVYRNDGLLPVRVSPPAIENMIASYQLGSAGATQVTAFTYEEDGHLFYVLTFPATLGNPNGSALAYDLTTGMWHERAHLKDDGVTLERPLYHCVASLSNFGGGGATPINFAGAWNSGKIYKMGLQYFSDDGNPRMYVRTAPHVSDADRWMKHASLHVSADTGGSTPMTLEYSNDGGRTFTGGPYTIVPSAEVPQRYKWYQLGRSRDRVYKTTLVQSHAAIRLINAYLNVDPGTEP